MKHFPITLFIISLALFVGACSNYRLGGTPTELPFKSVYVKPVRNNSYAAQATNLLTNEISNAINHTPNLRTALEGDAQATLSVSIISYERKPVATRADDTALAASYAMEATAECTLVRSNGDVVFKNRKVRARAMLYPNSANDVIGNEYQNMPVLMRELGGKIKDAVIGIW